MATAAALLGGTAAQAQYQYTDIPDTTIVDGIFELDLDGDTIVDFTIEHILSGGQLGNVNAILLHPGDSIEGNLAMGEGQNGFSYVEKSTSRYDYRCLTELVRYQCCYSGGLYGFSCGWRGLS